MSRKQRQIYRGRGARIPFARAARARSRSSPPSRWRRSATSASLIRRASRCRCARSPRIPACAYDYTAKGNLVAVISNGTAILGLGNLGALAVQAGDGRQGGAVQALRRRRFDRHRGEDRGRAAIHRVRRAARAELRRHQPRGHRRARLLHHRADAARADEHPGVPRRPARHRDHHRRRADQRLPS